MRGHSDSQPMITTHINLEKRVPQGNPLRNKSLGGAGAEAAFAF